MCFGLSRSSGNARQMTLNTATDRCTHLIYGRVQGVLVVNTSLSSQWSIIVITATWKYQIVVYETNSCKTKPCKWLKCVCSWMCVGKLCGSVQVGGLVWRELAPQCCINSQGGRLSSLLLLRYSCCHWLSVARLALLLQFMSLEHIFKYAMAVLSSLSLLLPS